MQDFKVFVGDFNSNYSNVAAKKKPALPTNSSNKKINRNARTSDVYNHYTDLFADKRLQCNNCEETFVASTSTLRRHLERFHWDKFVTLTDFKAKETEHTKQDLRRKKPLQSSKHPPQEPTVAQIEIIKHECFVCHQKFLASAVNLSAASKYSKRTIRELFGAFMSSAQMNSVAVCLDCKTETDEFDKFFTKAMEIKEKLLRKFQFAVETLLIKTEEESDNASMAEEFQIWPKIEVEEFKEPSDDDIDEDLSFDEYKPTAKLKKKETKSKSWECPFCRKHFESKSNFTRHKEIHSTELKYECPICNKRFKTKDCAHQHSKLHLKLKFFCDLCGSHFKTKTCLRKHIKRNHVTIKDFLCSECPKSYANGSELRNHLLTHSDVKKECCGTCGSRFYSKNMLRKHERMHSTAREFKCPICQKEFRQRYNMNVHIKTVHHQKNDEYSMHRFECNICGRSFNRKGILKKHLLSAHDVADGDEN